MIGPSIEAVPLAGTQPLTMNGDIAARMIDGIDRFLTRQTERSIDRRQQLWHRDCSSPAKYLESIAKNRADLARILGVVDPREHPAALSLVGTTAAASLKARGEAFDVYAVSWPALRRVDAEMDGEGLLLMPTHGAPVADVIAIPDADQTPEQLAGLTAGIPPEEQFARRLAESGCRVLIPTLISRSSKFSVLYTGEHLNQTHREFVYRPAFEMGRHVIGYELQKILAATDFLVHDREERHKVTKIAVIGYGEGGLLALYGAALDPRLDAAAVCGYFDSRQNLADEPIYRNVFGLLREFGDAEIASLVLPRTLIIEASAGPHIDGPPATQPGERSTAAPGRLVSPKLDSVKAEVERAKSLVKGLSPLPLQLIISKDGTGPFAAPDALQALLRAVAPSAKVSPLGHDPKILAPLADPDVRQHRQVDQMQAFTQSLIRESEFTRAAFWSKADRASHSPEKWLQSTAFYREYFRDQIVGRFDRPLLPPNPRTRLIYDTPKFTGYEVMLDVYPDVFAYGILLVPRDLQPGERRPVVVCQHGLGGRPQELTDPKIDSLYHHFAARLTEQGFITFSPLSPTLENFRTIHRLANPLGKSLYTFIVAQNQQITNWLASLGFVEPDRIAFYGMSYGGKSTMYVVPLVDRYCLAICSGNFNDWIGKVTALRFKPRQGYMDHDEYEMFEWDIGEHFNHRDLAALIAPRPFMVERGHRDPGADDVKVAGEYAAVRLLYLDLGIPDRTAIEFFDGPHTVHGVGTFQFLHKHLNWPEHQK